MRPSWTCGHSPPGSLLGLQPSDILMAMCGAGQLTVRETSRRVNRDIKSVHTDLTALLPAGVLERTEFGQDEFPYQAVKVEFLLQAA